MIEIIIEKPEKVVEKEEVINRSWNYDLKQILLLIFLIAYSIFVYFYK